MIADRKQEKMLRRHGSLFTYKHMRKLEYDYLCPFANKTIYVTDYIEHICNGTTPLLCGHRCQMWMTGRASDGCVMLTNPGEKIGKVVNPNLRTELATCEVCWFSKPLLE